MVMKRHGGNLLESRHVCTLTEIELHSNARIYRFGKRRAAFDPYGPVNASFSFPLLLLPAFPDIPRHSRSFSFADDPFCGHSWSQSAENRFRFTEPRCRRYRRGGFLHPSSGSELKRIARERAFRVGRKKAIIISRRVHNRRVIVRSPCRNVRNSSRHKCNARQSIFCRLANKICRMQVRARAHICAHV